MANKAGRKILVYNINNIMHHIFYNNIISYLTKIKCLIISLFVFHDKFLTKKEGKKEVKDQY